VIKETRYLLTTYAYHDINQKWLPDRLSWSGQRLNGYNWGLNEAFKTRAEVRAAQKRYRNAAKIHGVTCEFSLIEKTTKVFREMA
jgi:hypothetical protein